MSRADIRDYPMVGDNPTTTAYDDTVWLDAAERVAMNMMERKARRTPYACCALRRACADRYSAEYFDDIHHGLRDSFASYFKPEDVMLESAWWKAMPDLNTTREVDVDGERYDSDQDARIMALLFMHWMGVNP